MSNTTSDLGIDEYLFDPNNYIIALELNENLERINKKLEEEFWSSVLQSLSNRILDLPGIILFTKIEKNIDWFEISKNDWQYYSISTDKGGDYVEISKRKETDENGLKAYQEEIKKIIEIKKGQLVFSGNISTPCSKKLNNFNFQSKQDKLKLLPINRKDVIIECVNNYFEYLKVLIETCELVNSTISELQNAS